MDMHRIDKFNYIKEVNYEEKDRFKKGKKFRSRIKNISRDGKVELELDDGMILEARLEERISAGIGDLVLFEITESTEDIIKLKYIKEKGQGNEKFDIRV